MRRSIYLPLLLILFGCSHATPPAPTVSDTGATQSVHDGEALTKEEKLVKAYILDNADDPKSVEFARWGPNVSGAQLAEMYARVGKSWSDYGNKRWETEGKQKAKDFGKEGDADFERGWKKQYSSFKPPNIEGLAVVVRARYRRNNRIGAKELLDMLIAVGNDGQVNVFGTGSDDWLQETETLQGAPRK